jgi:hypothetical protein
MFNPVLGYDPDEPLSVEAAILLKEVSALCEKWLDEGRDLPAMIFALRTTLKTIRDTAVAMHEVENTKSPDGTIRRITPALPPDSGISYDSTSPIR